MSGGSLGYFYNSLMEHVGDFGDVELDDLVKDLAKLFHAREWFLSSDTGEGDWCEARSKFKAKWFCKDSRDERFRRYIDEAAEKLRDEFGLNDHKRCETCKHWTPKRNSYGECELETAYRTHRNIVCKKWEKKEGKSETDLET